MTRLQLYVKQLGELRSGSKTVKTDDGKEETREWQAREAWLEEFDPGKLHFLKQEDWWEETPLNEGAFWQAFEGRDVLLDYVEYDGRFHKRTDDLFGLSLDYYHRFEEWKYVVGAQFFDSRLKKLKQPKRK